MRGFDFCSSFKFFVLFEFAFSFFNRIKINKVLPTKKMGFNEFRPIITNKICALLAKSCTNFKRKHAIATIDLGQLIRP